MNPAKKCCPNAKTVRILQSGEKVPPNHIAVEGKVIGFCCGKPCVKVEPETLEKAVAWQKILKMKAAGIKPNIPIEEYGTCVPSRGNRAYRNTGNLPRKKSDCSTCLERKKPRGKNENKDGKRCSCLVVDLCYRKKQEGDLKGNEKKCQCVPTEETSGGEMAVEAKFFTKQGILPTMISMND